MKRPDGINLTTALMAIAVYLHLVAALASPLPIRLNESHGLLTLLFTVLATAVVGIAIVLFESIVLWFYWSGRNWARWTVVVGCLLCFVSLRHFFGGPVVSQGREIIIFYRMAIAIFIMAYLTTSAARDWFAPRSERS
jgi:hypothetical protein